MYMHAFPHLSGHACQSCNNKTSQYKYVHVLCLCIAQLIYISSEQSKRSHQRCYTYSIKQEGCVCTNRQTKYGYTKNTGQQHYDNAATNVLLCACLFVCEVSHCKEYYTSNTAQQHHNTATNVFLCISLFVCCQNTSQADHNITQYSHKLSSTLTPVNAAMSVLCNPANL